jgi:hypothetical protein
MQLCLPLQPQHSRLTYGAGTGQNPLLPRGPQARELLMAFDVEYPIDAPDLLPSGGSKSYKCWPSDGSTFESCFVVRDRWY